MSCGHILHENTEEDSRHVSDDVTLQRAPTKRFAGGVLRCVSDDLRLDRHASSRHAGRQSSGSYSEETASTSDTKAGSSSVKQTALKSGEQPLQSADCTDGTHISRSGISSIAQADLEIEGQTEEPEDSADGTRRFGNSGAPAAKQALEAGTQLGKPGDGADGTRQSRQKSQGNEAKPRRDSKISSQETDEGSNSRLTVEIREESSGSEHDASGSGAQADFGIHEKSVDSAKVVAGSTGEPMVIQALVMK